MLNFKQIQGDLQEAKKTLKQSQKAVLLSQEKLIKLDRKEEKVLRSADPDSGLMQELLREKRELQSHITSIEDHLNQQIKHEFELLASFQPFTDPRKHIQQFSDEYPVLLFPVRLETRFKKLTTPAGVLHQLWVRIFPDECSIDTFEDTLSETEISKARDYWSVIWSTGKSDTDDLKGFIRNRIKGAWRGLAGNLDAGRAYWITTQYKPENMANLPLRTSEDNIIFVISTEELPTENEQKALEIYWRDIYFALENQELIKNAFNELSTAAGTEEQANKLLAAYSPSNISDFEPPNPNTLPPPVIVSFIQFPKKNNIESKPSSWSQAARVTTLPEKFVLSGYKGVDGKGNLKQVLNELGAVIPDPLIMGPNPSLDTNKPLKNALIEEFLKLENDALKASKLADYYENFKDSVKEERKTSEGFITEFLALDEEEIEPNLEQVFDDLKDEIKAEKYIEYLTQHSETKWLFDFEESVKVGMGFKVNISAEVYNAGFDRLFVSGVKLSADEHEAKTALEELFTHHHYGSNGFSILPQGTPTNNTEDDASGFSEKENSEETFERYFPEEDKTDPNGFEEDPFKKRDGQWLSELLGIDADKASLLLAANYHHTDQCEARAMNVALWNATIGYFMQSMLTPVFSDWDVDVTRNFFTNYVSGRGNIPAIRISDQPYGILATSAIKKFKWLSNDTNFQIEDYADREPVFRDIYKLVMKVGEDWKEFSEKVAYVGKDGDAHQILLDVLGLHASSVQFEQRYAESFLQLYNRLKLSFPFWAGLIAVIITGFYKIKGNDFLKELGFTPDEEDELIPILEKFFFQEGNLATRDLIDDQPLSEKYPIRTYINPENEGDEGKNYIHWLIDTISDHNKLKKQEGFSDGAPSSLLYEMLRHSLDLEFSNTAFKLYEDAAILSSSQVKKAKIDADFLGIKLKPDKVESRYAYLESIQSKIANEEITVAQYISKLIDDPIKDWKTRDLKEITSALGHLSDVPTWRLERTFVEHLDCCTYRLDAWMLGFVNLQLQGMRYKTPRTSEFDSPDDVKIEPVSGIYLGAYGWVDDLKPDNEELTPVSLDSELKTIFNPDDKLDIVTDSSNAGYIHAPSINQAITSAVLRNAYISNASPEDPEIYKINLSSERVRMALSIIEGMQQGQSLGALLGYQLERGLHDRHEDAEVDSFIYELRKKFPLNANHSDETAENEDDSDSITQIEARNVIDGLGLVNHINETNQKKYPFGKNMKRGNAAEEAAINSEVKRILNINDAVADLAMAETVHQVVQSNYDRAAGVLDTYSKGGFPQSPDVVRTLRSGVSLTNRVGIHLKIGADIAIPPNLTPRVMAEPAINDFLVSFLPPLSDICCEVTYSEPTYNEGIRIINPDEITLHPSPSIEELGLNAIDLLYMLDIESNKSLTALDDYILNRVHADQPRPDIKLEIRYTTPITDENSLPIPNKFSLFEISPLINSLRSILLSSRPLQSSDMLLPNEANKASDHNCSIHLARITDAFDLFKIDSSKVEGELTNIGFTDLIDDNDFEESIKKKDEIVEGIDEYITDFITHLKSISQFGVPQSGFGFIYDRKASLYAAIYKKVLGYKKRWDDKTEKYGVLISQLSGTTNDEQKIEILQKAERTISTSYTIPLPDTPNTVTKYLQILDDKKAIFDNKSQELSDYLDSNFVNINDLINELDKLKTGNGSVTGIALNKFDLLTIETEEDERQIVVLAEDLKIQAISLDIATKATIKKVQELIDSHDREANPINKINFLTDASKLLFGEEFKLIPEFKLNPDQGNELKKCYENRDQLLKHQREDKGLDFPEDDWLYGIARVREKLSHWENTVILAEGFKDDNNYDLTPLQLPFKTDDTWLGLSFPESYEIESDKLLYTAYLNSFDESKSQCGLLIDEWTEVIPTDNETTGLSFQYDQPNAEPPQSMLLVTPTDFTGEWTWDDIEDALHETLDLAKLRAVEPEDYGDTAYAQFLPATMSAVTTYPFITMALNYGFASDLTVQGDNDA